jgi:hypothetical protein
MTFVKVIIYTSTNYDPAKVSGRYVRCVGDKREGYNFRVYETICDRNGNPGRGPTLREYETDGTEIPEEIKARAIKTKHMTLWDNPNGL